MDRPLALACLVLPIAATAASKTYACRGENTCSEFSDLSEKGALGFRKLCVEDMAGEVVAACSRENVLSSCEVEDHGQTRWLFEYPSGTREGDDEKVASLWAACYKGRGKLTVAKDASATPSKGPTRSLRAPPPLESFLELEAFKAIDGADAPLTVDEVVCRNAISSFSPGRIETDLAACVAACRHGDSAACLAAANWLMQTTGDEAADRAQAFDLFEQACESKQIPVSCYIWGEQLARGSAGPHDRKAATVAWNLGCKQSNKRSCDALNGRFVQWETHPIH